MEETGYLKLLLPEGMLDFFKITSAELKDDAYCINLEELNIRPDHLKEAKLTSKGFYKKVKAQDFPLRGKACYLNIKRRKWLNEDRQKRQQGLEPGGRGHADDRGIRAFFKTERLDSTPVSCKSLADTFHLNGKVLEHQYVFHLSDFTLWPQREHARDWILFPDNLGTHLSIDETSLSQGELYTVVTNKAAGGEERQPGGDDKGDRR